MQNKQIFITGIGTEVGKTVISAIFVEALQSDYLKPIQSGDLHYTPIKFKNGQIQQENFMQRLID